MELTYKDFESLELLGEYRGFNWSLDDLGNDNYITLKLSYIDNVWEIAKDIPKNYILHNLEKGTLNKYLKGMLDKIIESMEKAIRNKQDGNK